MQQKRSDVARAPLAALFESLRGRLAGGSKGRRPSEEVVLAVIQLAVEAVHSADRGADAGRESAGLIRELAQHLSRDRVRRAASVLINGSLKRAPPGGSAALDVVRGLLAPSLEAADVRREGPGHEVAPRFRNHPRAPPQENARKNALLLVADCAAALVGAGKGVDAASAASAPAAAAALGLALLSSVKGLGDASYAVVAAAQKAIARLRAVDPGFGDRLRSLPPDAQASVDRNADGIRQAAALLAQVSSLLGPSGGSSASLGGPAAAAAGPGVGPGMFALQGTALTGASAGSMRLGAGTPSGPAGGSASGRQSSVTVGPAPPGSALSAASAAPSTPNRVSYTSSTGGGSIRMPQGTPPPQQQQQIGATTGLISASAATPSGPGGGAGSGPGRPPPRGGSGSGGIPLTSVVSGPPAVLIAPGGATQGLQVAGGQSSSARIAPAGTGFGALPPSARSVGSSASAGTAAVAPAPAAPAPVPAAVAVTAPVAVGTTSPRPGAGRTGYAGRSVSPRPGAGAAAAAPTVSPRLVPVGAGAPLSPLETTARATVEAAAAASAARRGSQHTSPRPGASQPAPAARPATVVQTGVPVVIAGGPLSRGGAYASPPAANPAPAATDSSLVRRTSSSESGFVIHQSPPPPSAAHSSSPAGSGGGAGGGITMHSGRTLSRLGSNGAPGIAPVVVSVSSAAPPAPAAPPSEVAAAAAAQPPTASAASSGTGKPPLSASASAMHLLASPRGAGGPSSSAAGGSSGATSRSVMESLTALTGSRAHAAVLAGMCGVTVLPSAMSTAGAAGGDAAAAVSEPSDDAVGANGGPTIETRASAVAAFAAGLASIDSTATLTSRLAGSGVSPATLPAVLGLAAAAASRDASPRVAAIGLAAIPTAAHVMRLSVPLSAAYGPVSQLIQVRSDVITCFLVAVCRHCACTFCSPSLSGLAM